MYNNRILSLFPAIKFAKMISLVEVKQVSRHCISTIENESYLFLRIIIKIDQLKIHQHL